MAEAPFDQGGTARLTAEQIYRDYGRSGLDDPKLLNQLLPDLMPEAPRESSLLQAAASSGVAQMLTERVSQGMPVDAAIRDVSAVLAERNAFSATGCAWVVAEYARTLGYTANQPQPAPVPQPQPAPAPFPQPAPGPYGPTMPAPSPYPQPYPMPYPQPGPTPRKSRTGLIIGIVVAVVVCLGGGATAAVLIASAASKTGANCLVGTWRATSATQVASDSDGNSGTAKVTSGTEILVYKSDGTGHYSDTNLTFESTSDDSGYIVDAAVTYHYKVTAAIITYSSVAGTNTVTPVDSGTPGDPQKYPLDSLASNTFTCTGDTLTTTQGDSSNSYAAHYKRQ